MPSHLTKTLFVAGCQCHDLLWWSVHDPQAPELQIDISLEDRFEQGRQVSEVARTYVPGGVLVEPRHSIEHRIRDTRAVLDAGRTPIYEAAFMEAGVFVAVDILERTGDTFTLVEVKSTTSVKNEHIPDAAVQAHVLRSAGIRVGRVELMHLNRDCRYPDLANLFVREDITEQVQDVLPTIPDEIAAQLRVLERDFPARGFGEHCLTGRECPFHDRCWPKLDENHVLTLYRLKPADKWELLRRGIESIRDLPDNVRLNRQAARQVRAVKQNTMVLGPGLGKAMQQFTGRLAHLDFETVSLAIPVWNGFGPWHPMPVQFSCHVEVEPGRFEHHQYLAHDGEDRRADMARELVAACGDADGVVSYNANFERGCLRRLRDAAPDLAEELESISARLLDPLPVVRDYVYHPGFLGHFGLKHVLPALVPELGYDDLDISQGDIASLYLARLLFRPETVPPDERPTLRQRLLEYCARDTMATIALLQRLRDLAER